MHAVYEFYNTSFKIIMRCFVLGKKSTLYIDEDIKADVQIKLIKENKIKGENLSLSALVNKLLKEWLSNK
jgi:hypothetical protein